MIYIFTALYPEARPLIQYFNLTKDTENTRFQVFRDEENEICLTVTGSGSIAAAVAAASVCTEYGIKAHDFVINIGTCAGLNEGNIFLCNKIVELSTGKTFYPDILYRHSFDEAAVITGSKLLDVSDNGQMLSVNQKKQEKQQAEQKKIILYDMEAAAIYQAGAYFFGPHQMSFLKIVSDMGTAGNISAHMVEQRISAHMEKITAYIEQLCNIAEAERHQERLMSEQAVTWIEKLAADLHCSKVMQDSLRQHIRYLELAGKQYEDILRGMYEDGQLPCKDKREGKVRFEELKRKLL